MQVIGGGVGAGGMHMLRSRRALRHLRFPEADGVVYPTLRYGAGTQTEAFLAGMVSPLYERSVFLIGTQLLIVGCVGGGDNPRFMDAQLFCWHSTLNAKLLGVWCGGVASYFDTSSRAFLW